MAGLATPRRIEPDVAVGLVGPHALLERIVLAAGLPGQAGPDSPVESDQTGGARQHRRLLLAAYYDEREAPERASRLAHAADALLFAGPAPLAYATRGDAVSCPAASLELAGGPLAATLTRARLAGADPSRASFDSFSRAEVSQALADAGIPGSPGGGPQVREGLDGPAALASYHARLWQLGLTSAAVTSVEEVARRLAASQLPVFVVRPSDQVISAGLVTATLLAQVQALASTQLAVALVEVPVLRDGGPPGADRPRQACEETRLRVHAYLVREALRIGATVGQVSDHGFLVVATRGALLPGAGPAFAAGAQRLLGLTLDIGVGTGRTEREAEDAARADLRRAARPAESTAATIGGRPGVTHLPAHVPTHLPTRLATRLAAPRAAQVAAAGRADSLSRLRSLETLARLAQKLAADASPVVDAELTGKLLSVTPRTARRQLRALADQGLALPLPPRRTPHPGRPRQAYRLVVEKLAANRASG